MNPRRPASIKGGNSSVDALALIFGCQILVELLKTRMLDSGKDILPAVRLEGSIFKEPDFVIAERPIADLQEIVDISNALIPQNSVHIGHDGNQLVDFGNAVRQ